MKLRLSAINNMKLKNNLPSNRCHISFSKGALHEPEQGHQI